MKRLKIGTKVYHYQYGWGVIDNNKCIESYPYDVEFKDKKLSFTMDGKLSHIYLTPTLSLTEYNFVNGGFTPIDSEPPLQVGDMAYFWDSEDDYALYYAKIIKINRNGYNFVIGESFGFKNASKEIPQWFIDKNK